MRHNVLTNIEIEELIGMVLSSRRTADDMFDRSGLHAAVAHLNGLDTFIQPRKIMAAGLPFNDVAGVLRNFLQGLPGARSS